MEKRQKRFRKYFSISADEEIRTLALGGLDRMNNQAAKKELLALYENRQLETEWRNLCARYLQLAPVGDEQISSTGGK